MRKTVFIFFCFFIRATSICLSQLPVLTEQEKTDGWQLLFDGKTSTNWKSARGDKFPEKGWEINDGVLTVWAKQRGGDIVTSDQFENFKLALEFKLTPGANSGIKYNVQPNTSLGLEFQILDDELHPDAKQGVAGNRTVGSLYDLIPADNKIVKPIGEWNQVQIIVNGGQVEHWLNGNKVVEYERGTQLYRALIQKSKFKDFAQFGEQPQGHILLQDHGDTVSFRNIKIKVLPKL